VAPARLQFVVGIEDKQPFIWQLAVLLESLYDCLPQGWSAFVVVCNEHREISQQLRRVLDTYGSRWTTAPNYALRRDIDLMGGEQSYAALNKVGALEAVAPFLSDDDRICLLDTDLFLYGGLNLEIFPSGDALCQNWLIEKPLFFSGENRLEGVDLQTLLTAIGVEREFRGGGVLMFFTGETLRARGFISDCFRFAQTLYLLARIKQVVNPWISEMPVCALALTVRGIDYELIDRPEFSVENWEDREIPPGSFYHYFSSHAFAGSSWGKYHFRNRDLLEADLDRFLERAQTDHEKAFFQLAQAARDRLRAAPTERPLSRGSLGDRARYWHYHLRHALDPEAIPGKDLRLPWSAGLMYRLLAPLRSLRGRVEMRRRLQAAAARAAEAERSS